MQRDGRRRRGRAILPDRVDRVGLDRHEFRAGFFRASAQGLYGGRRVQPGVVADRPVARRFASQPARWRIGNEVADRKQLAVDLLARLDCVAAVDEDAGLVRQYDRRTGGAGEAGQPGEALGAGRHVFVLMLVGAGDNESRQAA